MFTVNGVELGEHDYYNLISAVRGPDTNTAGKYDHALDIKSVTAVVVRRALFGAQTAANHSNPPVPQSGDFLKLSFDEIYAAVPIHYIGHALKALRVLHQYQCALEEDRPLVKDILTKFRAEEPSDDVSF